MQVRDTQTGSTIGGVHSNRHAVGFGAIGMSGIVGLSVNVPRHFQGSRFVLIVVASAGRRGIPLDPGGYMPSLDLWDLPVDE